MNRVGPVRHVRGRFIDRRAVVPRGRPSSHDHPASTYVSRSGRRNFTDVGDQSPSLSRHVRNRIVMTQRHAVTRLITAANRRRNIAHNTYLLDYGCKVPDYGKHNTDITLTHTQPILGLNAYKHIHAYLSPSLVWNTHFVKTFFIPSASSQF